MSKSLPKPLIIDMHQCVVNVMEFTSGFTYNDFLTDRKTRDAVLRNIQVLGKRPTECQKSLENNIQKLNGGELSAHDTLQLTNTIRLTTPLFGGL